MSGTPGTGEDRAAERSGRERRSGGGRRYGTEPSRRLFVAVPLPGPIRSQVGELVAAVRADVDGDDRTVRWVRIDGLHLTVRFLGATTPERQAAVETAMRSSASASRPIRIALGGAGAFPSATRPRVLWLGLRDGAERLGALAADLEGRLTAAGWPPEGRPFAPHLTLARCDGARLGPRTAATLIARAADLELDWLADRVTLFESHVGGGPARYEPLVEVGLSAAAEGGAEA
jgi:2'-5' RNA ligase